MRATALMGEQLLQVILGYLYFCNGWKKARVVNKYKTLYTTRRAMRKGKVSFAPELGKRPK